MKKQTFNLIRSGNRYHVWTRIINDVLIARSAKRAGVTGVTYNVRHFEQIRRYCSVKHVNAAEYFGQ